MILKTMQLNKFFVVFLTLIARIFASKIILQSPELLGTFEVENAAIDVITSCYRNQGDAVGIGGHISGNLVKKISAQQIPVVLVNNSTSTLAEFRYEQRIFRYNLRVFVITIFTPMELKKFILEIKRSIWWNHMASFLILLQSPLGCGYSPDVLVEAWGHHILNAKLICFGPRSEPLIVGYNPYATQAPEPWQLVTSFPYRETKFKNNTFTIFKSSAREVKKICNTLDFDKSTNLNGYPVELLYVSYGEVTYMKHPKSMINYETMYNNILDTFVRVINGERVEVILNYTNKSKVTIQDILFGISPMARGLVTPTSRPFIETGLLAMTQHRGYKSQLQKILSVVDIYSNICVCIVLAVTLAFFVFFVRTGLIPAFLNVMRIICNTGFANLPQNTPPRLYLTSVLLFAVTMQGIYQGNLASLLTTEVPLHNVRTWQDLIDFGHTIYVPEGNMLIFADPVFEGRIIPVSDLGDCAEYVLHNSSVACVSYATVLLAQAKELKLYLSEKLIPTLAVCVFRPDWPLEPQFNLILGKLFEADVILPLNLRKYQRSLAGLNVDEDLNEEHHFRNITLSDLTFAFVILGLGLLCASITFIFEIVINRVCSKTRIRRMQTVRRFDI